jgi:glutathione S-transferase
MGLRFGSIESRPAFAEYWARVSDRDAYRRATELDDALMPKSV